MRPHALLATVLLLTACSADPEPQATPTQAPTSASPTPTPSYDPAWKTGFMTERAKDPTGKRTYTFAVAGTGPGDRLRPGVWITYGGPCAFTTANLARPQQGKAYEIDPQAGGWKPLPVTLELPEGARLTVVHDNFLAGDGCIWGWDKALVGYRN